MLSQAAAGTGASAWAIGSMLFFLGVFVVITVRTLRARADELAALARMPLDEDRAVAGEAGAGADLPASGVSHG